MLMVMVAALTNYLMSNVHDGKDKNNADYGSSSALLIIVASTW